MSPNSKLRVPVFSGPRILEFVRDEGSLRRYVDASLRSCEACGSGISDEDRRCKNCGAQATLPNVSITRRKGDGAVTRIDLNEAIEGSEKGHGQGRNSVQPTYVETLDVNAVVMMKRAEGPRGRFAFAKWGDSDGFDPKRFNPEREASRFAKRRIKPVTCGIGVVSQ